MGKQSHQSQETSQNKSGSLLETLVGWMPEFLVKGFGKLSPRARVVSYFVVLGILAFVVYKVVMFYYGERDENEIRGRLTLGKLAEIPDVHISRDLSADNLFVFKRPSPAGGRFTYEWILRVPQNAMHTPVTFGISEYYPEIQRREPLCEARFTPAELTKNIHEGKVYLKVDDLFTSIQIEGHPEGITSLMSSPTPAGFWFPSAYASPRQSERRQDSSNALIRKYRQSLNPVEQLSIRKGIRINDPAFTVQLAESLKAAVFQNRAYDVSTYARLLSDDRQLSVLTSSGSSRSTFDTAFYRRAVERLHVGTEYEARSMATFLQRLQDSRTVNIIVDEFQHATGPLTRKLCLYVLDGFATNSDPSIRAWVSREAAKLRGMETAQGAPRPPAQAPQLLRLIKPMAKAVANRKVKSDTPLYDFTLWLDIPSNRKKEVASVDYEFDHPTFRQKKQSSSNPKDGFRVGYLGWGCLRSVLVSVHLKDGTTGAIDFDMCEAVQF